MVTSRNAGLAVPDWPTTFGYNMFLFPASKWVGGILFEHTHRLIASTVGLLTVALGAWLWRAEPRRSVRLLGVAAVGAVVLQGVLGGLRVTMLKDEIGIFHACLAHAFLGLLVLIALLTSRAWFNFAARLHASPIARSLRTIAFVTTALIYFQLVLGATMRHQHRDLAITDFPTAYGQWLPDTNAAAIAHINVSRDAAGLSDVTPAQIWLQMAHRFGAVLVIVGVLAFFVRVRPQKITPLGKLSLGWLLGVFLQFTVGAWTIWSNKAADIATAHVAGGAIMLALGVIICAFTLRLPEKIPAVDFPSRRLSSDPIAA
jgi:cytochrome c oxidase assembly protein subunit 15